MAASECISRDTDSGARLCTCYFTVGDITQRKNSSNLGRFFLAVYSLVDISEKAGNSGYSSLAIKYCHAEK